MTCTVVQYNNTVVQYNNTVVPGYSQASRWSEIRTFLDILGTIGSLTISHIVLNPADIACKSDIFSKYFSTYLMSYWTKCV